MAFSDPKTLRDEFHDSHNECTEYRTRKSIGESAVNARERHDFVLMPLKAILTVLCFDSQ